MGSAEPCGWRGAAAGNATLPSGRPPAARRPVTAAAAAGVLTGPIHSQVHALQVEGLQISPLPVLHRRTRREAGCHSTHHAACLAKPPPLLAPVTAVVHASAVMPSGIGRFFGGAGGGSRRRPAQRISRTDDVSFCRPPACSGRVSDVLLVAGLRRCASRPRHKPQTDAAPVSAALPPTQRTATPTAAECFDTVRVLFSALQDRSTICACRMEHAVLR